MSKRWFWALIGAGALMSAPAARAADHKDGPAVLTDPSTDINDVFSWVQGGKVVLAMTVSPAATATSKFSNAALYVFHVNSSASFGAAQTETTIVCRFDAAQTIECWAGNDPAEYVTGDATATAGLASPSGKLKVFAGLREDPFFFNFDGFNTARSAVIAAAPSLTFDANGCPALDAATSNTLVGMLAHDPSGQAPVDFFAALNTLAIVVEVDPSLVNAGGPILGIWGSTNLAQ